MGYSFGGILAAEIARCLQINAHECTLTLLDPTPLYPSILWEREEDLMRLTGCAQTIDLIIKTDFTKQVEEGMIKDEDRLYGEVLLAVRGNFETVELIRRLVDCAIATVPSIATFTKNETKLQLSRPCTAFLAREGHSFYKTKNFQILDDQIFYGSCYGWSDQISSIEGVVVEGDHINIVSKNKALIVKYLKQLIAKKKQ